MKGSQNNILSPPIPGIHDFMRISFSDLMTSSIFFFICIFLGSVKLKNLWYVRLFFLHKSIIFLIWILMQTRLCKYPLLFPFICYTTTVLFYIIHTLLHRTLQFKTQIINWGIYPFCFLLAVVLKRSPWESRDFLQN